MGVMGVILGAIWGAASQVYANKKTTAMLQGIATIVAGVHTLFPNGQIGGAPVGLTPLLMNSGQVPANMIGSCNGTESGSAYANNAGLCALAPWGTLQPNGYGSSLQISRLL